MSHSVDLRAYRTALTTPGARGPVVSALLGRMPIAMVSLSLLFFVQRVTGSYAIAGAESAAALIGAAVGSVIQGRIMDRLGPTIPLLVTTLIFATFVTASVVSIERGAPVGVLVTFALCLGMAQPTIGSTSRAMWTRLLPSGVARTAAMTYEAIITEVYFIVGPALSGLLLTAPWAGTGVTVGASMMVVGSVWYALTPTMRGYRPDPSTVEHKRLLGALGSNGLRTLALASLGMGLTIGFVEVAVPAAANAAGRPAAGGVLLGLWSISSVVIGLLYSARPWPRPLHLRIPALLAAFGLLMGPMMIPDSLVGVGVALLLAGIIITPQTAGHAEAVEAVALTGLVTESFAWVITAATLGIGMGQAIGGQVIERFGIKHAYLVAGIIALVLAGAVFLRRASMVDSPATATVEPTRDRVAVG